MGKHPTALFVFKGVSEIIEMDETEYKKSYVEDSVLVAILSFYGDNPLEGQRIKDKLLYGGDPIERGTARNSASILQRWFNVVNRNRVRTRVP